jgi:preprotein translocase subunit Sss1
VRPRPVHASVSPLRDQFEQWTKIAVAVVAIVYVVGFIVHTLYLGAYGVLAVSLLRAQYILAGVWLLAPFALIGDKIKAIVYEPPPR